MRTTRALIWLCLIAGPGLLAYTAWLVIDPLAGVRQHQEQQQLLHSWRHPLVTQAAGRACVTPSRHLAWGQPFALIRIPRFGPRWQFAIAQGDTLPVLASGPGHIPGTAQPGQAGNVGMAAHDITAGNPFLHLGDLRPGERIVIITRNCAFTYRVTAQPRSVYYTDVAVLRARPGQHLITLVTCTPVTLAFTPHRIVVQGALTGRSRR